VSNKLERLLTAREAGEYLHISLLTLAKVEREGLLIPFRTPGSVLLVGIAATACRCSMSTWSVVVAHLLFKGMKSVVCTQGTDRASFLTTLSTCG